MGHPRVLGAVLEGKGKKSVAEHYTLPALIVDQSARGPAATEELATTPSSRGVLDFM